MEAGENRKPAILGERRFGDSLSDVAWLVETFSDLSGRSQEEVLRLLSEEHGNPGVTVRQEIDRRGVRHFEWSDGLLDFYSSTDAFLFESLVWNRSRLKLAAQDWIVRFLAARLAPEAKVLLYGDGLGFDSRRIAQAGFRAEYFEVSGKASKFARRLFDRERLDIPIHERTDDLPRGYDAVICLDVLEHVPDPPSMVKELASRLRDGGLMIVHAPFWYLTGRVPTHLRSNRKYSGDLRRLYEANGLFALDTALLFHPLALVHANQRVSPTFLASVRIAWSRLLLGIARYWALPHTAILELLRRPDLRRWEALELLRNEVAAGIRSSDEIAAAPPLKELSSTP